MTEPTKIPVTMRALIQRVNRKLARSEPGWCEQIKTSRSARAKQDHGEFYMIDTIRNIVTDECVDPEELGRKWEVLKPYEKVVD